MKKIRNIFHSYYIFTIILFFIMLSSSVYGASLNGKVVDSLGQPLSHIQIEIKKLYGSDLNFPVTITSSEGEFLFDEIPPSIYRLYAFDYLNGLYYQPPIEGEYGFVCDLTDYDDERKNIGQIILIRGGCIQGRVTNSLQEGLDNILIIAKPIDDPENPSFSREKMCFSKKDGSFRICGLEPKSYRLKMRGATEMGYADINFNADIVTLAPGEMREGMNYELNIGGMINGIISDVEGNPLPHIYIQWEKLDLNNPQSGLVESNMSGEYAIYGLDEGIYMVETKIEHSVLRSLNHSPAMYINNAYHSPVEVKQGTETPGIDIVLYRGGIISGKVFYYPEEESPYVGLIVVAEKVTDSRVYRSAPLDRNGEYTIYGLDEGTYWVYIETLKSSYFNYGHDSKTYFAQFYKDTFVRDEATLMSIQLEEEKRGIDFVYQRGVSIEGILYNNKTGTPLDSFFGDVKFYSEDHKEIKSVRLYLTTNLTDGFYIEGIPPGKYYLLFHDDYNIYEDAYYNETGKETTLENATLIDLESDMNTLPLNVFLGSIKGCISGRVVREIDQEPITNLPIMIKKIYDRSGINRVGASSIVLTDDNGDYCFEGLDVGDYFIITMDRNYIYTNELYSDNPLDYDEFIEISMMHPLVPAIMVPEKATIIHLAASEDKKGINIALSVGNSYRGPKLGYLGLVLDQFIAPEIISTPDETIPAGDMYKYQVIAIDEDPDDSLRYNLERAPENMVIDEISGLITWDTDTSDKGVEIIKIVVYDSHNMMASQAYALTVLDNKSYTTLIPFTMPGFSWPFLRCASSAKLPNIVLCNFDYSLSTLMKF
ncbi:MAG: hypothetical protein ACMUJM_12230 [bacterium]